MMKNKITIIDIGSHEFEELSVLLNPRKHQLYIFIKWTIRKFIKTLLRMEFQRFTKIDKYFKLLNFYFIRSRKYHLNIISIEPNMKVSHRPVMNLRRKYPVHYLPLAILGHDSENNINLKKLFFYDHSISSSIYNRGREVNEYESSTCVGIKFGFLWDQLIKEKIINEGDPFILRMNCEGAELGVIDECAKINLKPLCIIGSLGDVLKIHGVDADKKIMELLFEMGTPYHYFKGEDPDTWYNMISIWKKYTDDYLVK